MRGASAADSGKGLLPEYLSFSEKRSENHLLSYGARCIFKVSPFFQAHVLRLFFARPKVSPLAAVAWFPGQGAALRRAWRYNGVVIIFYWVSTFFKYFQYAVGAVLRSVGAFLGHICPGDCYVAGCSNCFQFGAGPG